MLCVFFENIIDRLQRIKLRLFFVPTNVTPALQFMLSYKAKAFTNRVHAHAHSAFHFLASFSFMNASPSSLWASTVYESAFASSLAASGAGAAVAPASSAPPPCSSSTSLS